MAESSQLVEVSGTAAVKNNSCGQTIPYGVNGGFLNSAGTIPVMNIAVGLEVLGGLSIIIVYMTSGLKMLEEGE